MRQVQFGSTGLSVSQLCLGMMSFGSPSVSAWLVEKSQADPIVRRAVEHGVTFFDTADVYAQGESESITGELLRKYFTRRDEYVLATKVGRPFGTGPNDHGLSRKHILSSIDASLARLGVDYVDLYQIHRWDPDTPADEVMEALNDIIRAGKARYIGASSMYAWEFSKAQYVAARNGWSRFVSMQNHYNLLYREEEREMMPLITDQGVACIPWSPLARGKLARPFEAGDETVRAQSDDRLAALYQAEHEQEVRTRVAALATEREVSPAQIALAWLLHKPVVTAPIVGARSVEQLDDLVRAVDVALSTEDIAYLETPYTPQPLRF